MKNRKLLAGILITAVVSTMSVFSAWAGEWKNDGDRYWYQNDDGSFMKEGVQEIDGSYYAFDAEGYMLTGWQKIFPRQYYFSPETGAQVRGWLQVDGKWYYLDPDNGNLHLGGPEKIDGELYYFRWDNGMMRQNEIFCACDSDDGRELHGRSFYHATENGVLKHDMEERNPDNPYEIVKYDEKGRIIAYNKETDRYDDLRCDNDEHVKNSDGYRHRQELRESWERRSQ